MARKLDQPAAELEHSIIHLLHRSCQVAEEHFARMTSEVTARQFVVLEAVAQHPGASQTLLGHVTGVDRSTLADIVRRLTKRGLLQRRRTRADARAYDVRLTEGGAAMLERLRAGVTGAEHLLLSSLSKSEREMILALLHRITEAATARNPDQQPQALLGLTARS